MQLFCISFCVTCMTSFVAAIDLGVWIVCFDFSKNDVLIIPASVIGGGHYLPHPQNTEALVPPNWVSGGFGNGWQLRASANKAEVEQFKYIQGSENTLLTISFEKPPIIPSGERSGKRYYPEDPNGPSLFDEYPEGSLWEIKLVGGPVNYICNLIPWGDIAFNFELVSRKYFVRMQSKLDTTTFCILEGEVNPDNQKEILVELKSLSRIDIFHKEPIPKASDQKVQGYGVRLHKDAANIEYEIVPGLSETPKIVFEVMDNTVGLFMKLHSNQNFLTVKCITKGTVSLVSEGIENSFRVKISFPKINI